MTFFSSGVLRKILREIYQDPFVLPQTKIIIDCTDVFVQKTTSPSTQRATWSSYKQHNTMKALVGITPTGFFSLFPNSGLEMSVTDALQRKLVC